ncbi:MAG: serine hydrolase, partial [Firmicutes bacterium]|nr:serine hydrolase [Bacillota bacterium]
EAVGWAELGENPRAMHLDTLFDLASLTKVVATLPVILDLAAEGRLTREDPVGRFLPAYRVGT